MTGAVQLALPDHAPNALTAQKAKVLGMLRSQDAVCGVEFLRAYLPRFGGRVHELRRLGYVIERRQCHVAAHGHITTQWAYALVGSPVSE